MYNYIINLTKQKDGLYESDPLPSISLKSFRQIYSLDTLKFSIACYSSSSLIQTICDSINNKNISFVLENPFNPVTSRFLLKFLSNKFFNLDFERFKKRHSPLNMVPGEFLSGFLSGFFARSVMKLIYHLHGAMPVAECPSLGFLNVVSYVFAGLSFGTTLSLYFPMSTYIDQGSAYYEVIPKKFILAYFSAYVGHFFNAYFDVCYNAAAKYVKMNFAELSDEEFYYQVVMYMKLNPKSGRAIAAVRSLPLYRTNVALNSGTLVVLNSLDLI